MYWRFTDRARKVMQLANQEAQRFNHESVGTEHILLGLVKEGSGVAANVLKNLDIDLPRARLEVEEVVQPGPSTVTPGRLPQTPLAKKVIEHATEEARKLNHNYVGTEHLLLGLLREEDAPGARVLRNLGFKLEEVREYVLLWVSGDLFSDRFLGWVAGSGRSVGLLVSGDVLSGGFLRACRRAGQGCRRVFVEGSRPGAAERSRANPQEQRLQVLEGQLRNVRVVLSVLTGVLVGALLGGEPGAVAGLLVGTAVGLIGGRFFGALAGALPGAVLVVTHLPEPAWALVGLVGGAVLGACLGDIGPPLRPRR